MRDWPVLDLGVHPTVSLERWRLRLTGAVENPQVWNWTQFMDQPQTEAGSDIHCVTTWSRYDNDWEGVATADLLATVAPRSDARFVVLHSHDGYTTNLMLEDFAAEGAMLAHSLGWQTADAEAWRAGTAGGAASLFLEKRRSGSTRIEFAAPRTDPASGRCAAIITAAIPGTRPALLRA